MQLVDSVCATCAYCSEALTSSCTTSLLSLISPAWLLLLLPGSLLLLILLALRIAEHKRMWPTPS